MARMARVVVPHFPHHITQRGNRKQRTFFSEGDYRAYLRFLVEEKASAGVDIWAYCLMPNDVHLVAVPEHQNSLCDLFSNAHRRYTQMVNKREGWRGHLWQERFHSYAMDEYHLLQAVRYIELNPVRAQLCHRPDLWMWSSIHAHIRGHDDDLVSVHPMLKRVQEWRGYLNVACSHTDSLNIQRHSQTGRPLGSNRFMHSLERITGRRLVPEKPGPRRG